MADKLSPLSARRVLVPHEIRGQAGELIYVCKMTNAMRTNISLRTFSELPKIDEIGWTCDDKLPIVC